MVFARRLWASRITQKAGFPIRSQEARLLINLLMRASKKNPDDHLRLGILAEQPIELREQPGCPKSR